MKNAITFAVIGACSLLASCKHEQPVQPGNNIALVDLSPSRDSSEIRWYEETIQVSVLGKMRPIDRVTALPIDFNSETSSQEIFKVDFSKNDYSNEYAGLQKDQIEAQNHQDSVNADKRLFALAFDAARLKRKGLRSGTDIFGALAQCRKYLVPGHRNVVTILSDMLQFTDRDKWDFEDHLNSVTEVDHYLATAPKIDLTDMQIIVLTGDQNNMRPEKFDAVRTFWEKYFKQNNGTLIDYSSGAVTKLEEAISK